MSPTLNIGFTAPSLTGILSFVVKSFFMLAALIALLYLLLGALAWITSGGNKESVSKAQKKIQSAIVGLLVIVAIVAIAVTLETVVFNKKICFGFTCPIIIPELIH